MSPWQAGTQIGPYVLVAALNHPHICKLYDVGPDYLVLEYVEGTVLKGPLSVAEALRPKALRASPRGHALEKMMNLP